MQFNHNTNFLQCVPRPIYQDIQKSLQRKLQSQGFSMCRNHWETVRGLVQLGKGKGQTSLNIPFLMDWLSPPVYSISLVLISLILISLLSLIDVCFTYRQTLERIWASLPEEPLHRPEDILQCLSLPYSVWQGGTKVLSPRLPLGIEYMHCKKKYIYIFGSTPQKIFC